MTEGGPERVRPATQLTHPLFLAAAILLALNDHLWKGSGLLPAALTGKISDVAGLLVAPLTLAWLLRVRSRRGWILAHLAVGLGFALLQLEPVASALSRTGWVAVWADPTDLLALPMLALSYRVLSGRAWGANRAAIPRAAIGLVALALCTATSPASGPPPRYPFPPAGRVEADVVVRHTGSEDIEIAVRRLRDETTVDCDGLLDVPQRMLEGSDFSDERRWTLSRGDAIPLWDRRGGAVDRDCYAVMLTDPHGREWLVTWRHGAPALRPWPIRLEPNAAAEPDAVRLGASPDDPPAAPDPVTVRRRI